METKLIYTKETSAGPTEKEMYFQSIKHFKVMSQAEEQVLASKIVENRNELSFRNEFVQRNLRLVVSVAKNYYGQHLKDIDLIQEGNIGLLKAVDKFDPEKGVKFSTYAAWWIRQAIVKAICDQDRSIRIPVNKVNTINKIRSFIKDYFNEYGSAPTCEYMSEHLGISVEKLRALEPFIFPEEVSLDQPLVGGEQGDSLYLVLEDNKQRTVEQQFAYDEFRATLRKRMQTCLSEKEITILLMRYGIEPFEKSHTLEAVSKRFNITKERVRQIEARAIIRMRQARNDRELVALREMQNTLS